MTPARGLAHTDRPDPRDALQAKFSVQYCVARALLHGKVVLEHFEGEACHDPAVRALLSRVHARAFVKDHAPSDNPFNAEVKVTLTDGAVLRASVDQPLGRTAATPIAPAQMKAKFENCAQRVLAPDAVAAASRAIDAFEELGSVREFTTLLEPSRRLALA